MRQQLGRAKFQVLQAIRSATYRISTPWSKRLVTQVWEEQARMIHEQWGEDTHDFGVLGNILTYNQVHAVLDVGCGSGRLFALYAHHGISDILGMDISKTALELAHERHPLVQTTQMRLEELDFPAKRFDLAICNRVLQHVPPHAIGEAVKRLTHICRLVYVNELAESDNLAEEFYMFRHDYPALFAQQGCTLLTQGTLGKQTYRLFG